MIEEFEVICEIKATLSQFKRRGSKSSKARRSKYGKKVSYPCMSLTEGTGFTEVKLIIIGHWRVNEAHVK